MDYYYEAIGGKVLWSILSHLGYTFLFFYLWSLLALYTDYVLLRKYEARIRPAAARDGRGVGRSAAEMAEAKRILDSYSLRMQIGKIALVLWYFFYFLYCTRTLEDTAWKEFFDTYKNFWAAKYDWLKASSTDTWRLVVTASYHIGNVCFVVFAGVLFLGFMENDSTKPYDRLATAEFSSPSQRSPREKRRSRVGSMGSRPRTASKDITSTFTPTGTPGAKTPRNFIEAFNDTTNRTTDMSEREIMDADSHLRLSQRQSGVHNFLMQVHRKNPRVKIKRQNKVVNFGQNFRSSVVLYISLLVLAIMMVV